MTESGREPETAPPFLARVIATGAFCGYVPWASGTFGTLLGLALVLIPGAESPPVLISMILVGFFAGVAASRSVAMAVGHQLTPVASRLKSRLQPNKDAHPDPSIVVIDEIVGMWIGLLLLPKTFVAYGIAFVLFRIFDVLKPEPARTVEHLPGGWGIMLDDLVAGLYANLLTHLLLFLFTLAS